MLDFLTRFFPTTVRNSMTFHEPNYSFHVILLLDVRNSITNVSTISREYMPMAKIHFLFQANVFSFHISRYECYLKAVRDLNLIAVGKISASSRARTLELFLMKVDVYRCNSYSDLFGDKWQMVQLTSHFRK